MTLQSSGEQIAALRAGAAQHLSGTERSAVGLIVNADDWGRDRENTDRIMECFRFGTLSSTSGMVFMEDSERAADIARASDLDVGLHLNLTTPFSSPNVSKELLRAQARLTRFLRRSRLAQIVFHPGLAREFRYVVEEQIQEYGRLYGRNPKRIDGHHHMHLCANVLLGGLLPIGTIVRRSFSFNPGEKSGLNRMYRRWVDGKIRRSHPITDFFFSIEPINNVERLKRIANLARTSLVELETHPINQDEIRFLTSRDFVGHLGSTRILRDYRVGSE